MSRSSRSDRTLYVGNLPGDIREREVEDLFYKYGSVVHIELKVPPRPPGYAFVEFEDVRDAEDAIRGRDGYDFDGHRLRVELAHGGRGNSSTDRHSSHSSSRGPRGGVSRRSDYRVLISGLPHSASWQDLKDHMRRAGDVCFSQVFNEGSGKTGIADYTNYDDMKYAIKKLDDTEFRNAFSRARIHVKEYDSTRSRSRSRSPSYLKGKSNGRDRSASLSNSRSKSKSPKRKASHRSRSRSKSVSSRSHSGSKAHPVSRSPSRSRSPKPSVSLSSSPVIVCLFVFLGYLCSWNVIKRLVLLYHCILVFAFSCLFLTSFSSRNMQVRVQKDAVQAEAEARAPARVVAGVILAGERLADPMNVDAVVLIH